MSKSDYRLFWWFIERGVVLKIGGVHNRVDSLLIIILRSPLTHRFFYLQGKLRVLDDKTGPNIA